jgi:hypothetical protein
MILPFARCIILSSIGSAEFMLDVIGAGATATSEQDWHDLSSFCPLNVLMIPSLGTLSGSLPEIS